MKYTNNNKPLVCMMTQSSCYKQTTTMTIKGILWHSTGANNPTLRRYVQPDDNAKNRQELLNKIGKNQYGNDLNHTEEDIGLNAWIGQLADGTVAAVQTMPWNFRPWGCGSGSKGSCNSGWIQFEICEDGLTDSSYFNKVYKEACELTAYLCKLYNINPNGTVKYNGVNVPTILCHHDSYQLGLGSGHYDIYNWFPNFNKDMTNVRKDVTSLLNSHPTPAPTPTPSSKIVAGDLVSIASNAVYYNGATVPSWVKKMNWYVSEVSGDRAVIDKSEDGQCSINSPISTKYLTKVKSSTTPSKATGVPYSVVTELPYYVSADNAKKQVNKVGTYAPGTYYIYNKYPKGYRGMYNITTDSTGKNVGSWINPAENVKDLYRVRKSWKDQKTQKGAYYSISSAKALADQYAKLGYKVYNSKGKVVYTPKTK